MHSMILFGCAKAGKIMMTLRTVGKANRIHEVGFGTFMLGTLITSSEKSFTITNFRVSFMCTARNLVIEC